MHRSTIFSVLYNGRLCDGMLKVYLERLLTSSRSLLVRVPCTYCHLCINSSPSPLNQFGQQIQSVFNSSFPETERALKRIKPFPAEQLQEKIQMLRSLQKEGLTLSDLAKNVNLFELTSSDFQNRLKFYKNHVKKNPLILSHLLRLSPGDYAKLMEFISHKQSRIAEFSVYMECSHQTAVRLFIKYPYLLRTKMSTVKKKSRLLLEYGIPKEDLLKDLWVLTYTSKNLEDRLKLAQHFDLSPIKTWMLRCKPEILNRTYNYREENKAALAPCSSTTEFLCQHLNITPEQIVTFKLRYPQVMRVQVSKLKEIINFLYSEGFTPLQIYRAPRVLCYSLTTLQNRMETLAKLNYRPESISILCRNARKFNELILKLTSPPGKKNVKKSLNQCQNYNYD